jgi:hypothetical protein
MEIDNVRSICEMDILVAEEDCPDVVDTTLLMYLIPYKCGYESIEDVLADGKTPVMKKVKLIVVEEDA